MVFMKQFGVKRSGTNYIRALLMRNFDVTVLVNILGWKHGLYEPPMSWLALTGAYLNEMPKWLYSELERLIDWSWASEMLQYASDGSF